MTWLFGMQGEDGKRLSRPLLRRAAALAWGWRALPELARSGRGKPYFRHWPERWFSLSHSGGLTLCALSDDGPVGVDVEVERPRRPGLMAYALSPAEQAACRGDWGEFYRLWTLKESWCPPVPTAAIPDRAGGGRCAALEYRRRMSFGWSRRRRLKGFLIGSHIAS